MRGFVATVFVAYVSRSRHFARPWTWISNSNGVPITRLIERLLCVSCLAMILGLILPAKVVDAQNDRYEIAADTVKDRQTTLIWQRSDDGTTLSWDTAKQHCQSLGSGWRLPALKELLTIVDPTRFKPAIDSAVFGSTSGTYWTGSMYATASDEAWAVNFDSGSSAPSTLDHSWRVRCVR